MSPSVDLFQTQFSRMWLIEGTAGPAKTPRYQGLWRAGSPSWAKGDVTPVYLPSSTVMGEFDLIDKVPGERGLPTMSVMGRYTFDASRLLKLVQTDCDHDLQVHMGKCKDPQNFSPQGWTKILVLEHARPTNWSTDDLGALSPNERAPVVETVPFTGERLYEITQMNFTEMARAQVVNEVVDITVCDSAQCGVCGPSASDGCQTVLALTKSNAAGGSPGANATIVYTLDGGATWSSAYINSLTVGDNPDALACVGPYIVVVASTGTSGTALHYALTSDVVNGLNPAWTRVTTGFVAGGGPTDIFTLGGMTWMTGLGGYIYSSDDITASVAPQTSGGVTTQTLNAIHGIDLYNLVAVGNNNAVLVTRNGGITWQSVTGPSVGVNLNTVFMKTEDEWWVGTAGGKLYYTLNGGVTWTLKATPNNSAGSVKDIVFVTNSVGFMAHQTSGTVGRIYRTVDGGHSWYVMPEGTGSIPNNASINALAACWDPNIIFGAGLAPSVGDGIIVKGA